MIIGLDGEKKLSNKVQVLKNKSSTADKTGPGVGLMSLTQAKKKRKKKVSLEFGLMLDKTITNLKTGFKLTVDCCVSSFCGLQDHISSTDVEMPKMPNIRVK